MTLSVAKRDLTEGFDVPPDEVRIGKDIIELVTSGMYVFPVTIFREYVQNAVDAVEMARAQRLIGSTEPGTVSIDIDHTYRSVVIRDNGCGIAASEAASTLVAVGASPKRGTGARGFRGVGRLSGLAYCRELEFRTKAAGDPSVVSVVWDCKALRSRRKNGVASAGNSSPFLPKKRKSCKRVRLTEKSATWCKERCIPT